MQNLPKRRKSVKAFLLYNGWIRKETCLYVHCTTVQESSSPPWAVTLLFSPDPSDEFCRGTLVASSYVVTAAHCAFAVNESLMFVKIGGDRVVAVNHTIIHEDYDESSFHNDIALVYLSEHLDLTVHTPACLAKPTDVLVGQNASLARSASKLPVVASAECGEGEGDAMVCARAADRGVCEVSRHNILQCHTKDLLVNPAGVKRGASGCGEGRSACPHWRKDHGYRLWR